jgi:hypothetical protein
MAGLSYDGRAAAMRVKGAAEGVHVLDQVSSASRRRGRPGATSGGTPPSAASRRWASTVHASRLGARCQRRRTDAAGSDLSRVPHAGAGMPYASRCTLVPAPAADLVCSRNASIVEWSVPDAFSPCCLPRRSAKAQATASTWGGSRSLPNSRLVTVAAEVREAPARPVRAVTASTHTGGAMNRPTTSSARSGREYARRGPAVTGSPRWMP